jgi:hypothetical protein
MINFISHVALRVLDIDLSYENRTLREAPEEDESSEACFLSATPRRSRLVFRGLNPSKDPLRVTIL